MDAATDALSPAIFIPAEWSVAANFIAYNSVSSPPPIVSICGAKNCGKSTFSRHLVNVLLHNYQKVAYLDTDVGQTEFAPPGCLSLNIIDKMTPDLAHRCPHFFIAGPRMHITVHVGKCPSHHLVLQINIGTDFYSKY